MFVRWKRRERGKAASAGKYLLTAALVRSERRDGKPRQKVVAYLGSIREEWTGEVWPRKQFWEFADKVLGAAGLDAQTTAKAEAALLSRVARPTPEEVARAKQQRNQRIRELAKMVQAAGCNPHFLLRRLEE